MGEKNVKCGIDNSNHDTFYPYNLEEAIHHANLSKCKIGVEKSSSIRK